MIFVNIYHRFAVINESLRKSENSAYKKEKFLYIEFFLKHKQGKEYGLIQCDKYRNIYLKIVLIFENG